MNDRRPDSPDGPAPDYPVRELEARMERRVSILEARTARARGAALVSGVGFLMAVAALGMVLQTRLLDDGTRSLTSLAAQEITLVDEEGGERGRLATDPEGRAVLSLSDRDGRERIRMTVLPDGSPGVTINDPDAQPRAVLGYLPDGTTNLVFTDRSGAIRTLVGVGPDGEPSMTVFETPTDETGTQQQ